VRDSSLRRASRAGAEYGRGKPLRPRSASGSDGGTSRGRSATRRSLNGCARRTRAWPRAAGAGKVFQRQMDELKVTLAKALEQVKGQLAKVEVLTCPIDQAGTENEELPALLAPHEP